MSLASRRTTAIAERPDGAADWTYKQRQKKKSGNLEKTDDDGKTALHLAAAKGDKFETQQLLEQGASLETPDQDGNNALHLAVKSGNHTTARLILEKVDSAPFELDASIRAANNAGNTPLHIAATLHDVPIVSSLLELDADITATNADGLMPLHLALKGEAKEGLEGEEYEQSPPIMLALLAAGAPINATDKQGRNALHIAYQNGCWDAALAIIADDRNLKMLLLREAGGKTPIELGVENWGGDKELAAAAAEGNGGFESEVKTGAETQPTKWTLLLRATVQQVIAAVNQPLLWREESGFGAKAMPLLELVLKLSSMVPSKSSPFAWIGMGSKATENLRRAVYSISRFWLPALTASQYRSATERMVVDVLPLEMPLSVDFFLRNMELLAVENAEAATAMEGGGVHLWLQKVAASYQERMTESAETGGSPAAITQQQLCCCRTAANLLVVSDEEEEHKASAAEMLPLLTFLLQDQTIEGTLLCLGGMSAIGRRVNLDLDTRRKVFNHIYAQIPKEAIDLGDEFGAPEKMTANVNVAVIGTAASEALCNMIQHVEPLAKEKGIDFTALVKELISCSEKAYWKNLRAATEQLIAPLELDAGRAEVKAGFLRPVLPRTEVANVLNPLRKLLHSMPMATLITASRDVDKAVLESAFQEHWQYTQAWKEAGKPLLKAAARRQRKGEPCFFAEWIAHHADALQVLELPLLRLELYSIAVQQFSAKGTRKRLTGATRAAMNAASSASVLDPESYNQRVGQLGSELVEEYGPTVHMFMYCLLMLFYPLYGVLNACGRKAWAANFGEVLGFLISVALASAPFLIVSSLAAKVGRGDIAQSATFVFSVGFGSVFALLLLAFAVTLKAELGRVQTKIRWSTKQYTATTKLQTLIRYRSSETDREFQTAAWQNWLAVLAILLDCLLVTGIAFDRGATEWGWDSGNHAADSSIVGMQGFFQALLLQTSGAFEPMLGVFTFAVLFWAAIVHAAAIFKMGDRPKLLQETLGEEGAKARSGAEKIVAERLPTFIAGPMLIPLLIIATNLLKCDYPVEMARMGQLNATLAGPTTIGLPNYDRADNYVECYGDSLHCMAAVVAMLGLAIFIPTSALTPFHAYFADPQLDVRFEASFITLWSTEKLAMVVCMQLYPRNPEVYLSIALACNACLCVWCALKRPCAIEWFNNVVALLFCFSFSATFCALGSMGSDGFAESGGTVLAVLWTLIVLLFLGVFGMGLVSSKKKLAADGFAVGLDLSTNSAVDVEMYENQLLSESILSVSAVEELDLNDSDFSTVTMQRSDEGSFGVLISDDPTYAYDKHGTATLYGYDKMASGKKTPAELAGVRIGSRIVAVDGNRTKNKAEVSSNVKQAGDEISLTYVMPEWQLCEVGQRVILMNLPAEDAALNATTSVVKSKAAKDPADGMARYNVNSFELDKNRKTTLVRADQLRDAASTFAGDHTRSAVGAVAGAMKGAAKYKQNQAVVCVGLGGDQESWNGKKCLITAEAGKLDGEVAYSVSTYRIDGNRAKLKVSIANLRDADQAFGNSKVMAAIEAVDAVLRNYDEDGDGELDLREFKALLEGIGAPATMQSDADGIFKRIDADDSGQIDAAEFGSWWASTGKTVLENAKQKFKKGQKVILVNMSEGNEAYNGKFSLVTGYDGKGADAVRSKDPISYYRVCSYKIDKDKSVLRVRADQVRDASETYENSHVIDAMAAVAWAVPAIGKVDPAKKNQVYMMVGMTGELLKYNGQMTTVTGIEPKAIDGSRVYRVCSFKQNSDNSVLKLRGEQLRSLDQVKAHPVVMSAVSAVDKVMNGYDMNGDGVLDPGEFTALLKGIGATQEAQDDSINLFKEVDSDGSGEIDAAEFACWWALRSNGVLSEDKMAQWNEENGIVDDELDALNDEGDDGGEEEEDAEANGNDDAAQLAALEELQEIV